MTPDAAAPAVTTRTTSGAGVGARVRRLAYQPELDGVRAVAVALVLVNHALGFYIGWPTAEWFGWVGVMMFFVLSGYLITGLLVSERSESGSIDIAAFVRRRARRLLPAYIGMLALVVPLAALADAGTRLGFAASLTFTSNLFPLTDLGVFGHTWTLSTEWQFYLLWPLGLLVIGRSLLVAVTALGVLAWVALGAPPPPTVPLLGFVAIAAGSWLGTTSATFPRIPPLAALAPIGLRAYSLYLWNWPLVAMLGPVLGTLTTLPAAELSYRLLERPFMRPRLREERLRAVPDAQEVVDRRETVGVLGG